MNGNRFFQSGIPMSDHMMDGRNVWNTVFLVDECVIIILDIAHLIVEILDNT